MLATRIKLSSLLIVCSIVVCSCQTIDLFEKNVSIPGHDWNSNFKPQFHFTITDTTTPYRVFIVLRHSEKYNYNNIWLNLSIKAPGDTVQKVQYELPLANSDQGWMGTAMDDLYEHRISLTPNNQDFYFKRAGDYVFTIEQIMREDPLQHVYNIGVRIEKKQQ
jgi:gliding motility-associated lipoprotein GldH